MVLQAEKHVNKYIKFLYFYAEFHGEIVFV